MADYPLSELNAVFTEHEGERIGLNFDCPNCGTLGGVAFEGTQYQKKYPQSAFWTRTGDTLETISLVPSLMRHGHFHSWIRNGKLCVDSIFFCEAKAKKGN